MKQEFLLVSKKYQGGKPEGIASVYNGNWFLLYTQNTLALTRKNFYVFIDGYVLPRNSSFLEEGYSNPEEFISDLFKKHGPKLPHFIKGIFTIIIIEAASVYLFTDQLGISKVFYYNKNDEFCISNNYNNFSSVTGLSKMNGVALAVKSLLNREINSQTLISDILYTSPSTQLKVTPNSFEVTSYWTVDLLLNQSSQNDDIDFFSGIIKRNIRNYRKNLRPEQNAITLTGGKDSRTVLAALLNQDIKPTGFTYGDPKTLDVVFAEKLAKKAGVEHLIVDSKRTFNWFNENVIGIINLDNPLINIHRSHRYAAIRKLNQVLGSNTALYTGYMGGELLMGVFFDNLIFTDFIKNYWQSGESQFDSIPLYLKNNFIRNEVIDLDDVKVQLSSLKSFDVKQGKNKMQFHSLFEIGVLHHSQDLQISQQYLDFPIPFFLDIEFLELLFNSKFSFLLKNVESKNPLKRYSLYEFNLKMQHLLWPDFDSVFFGKKGTYNTSEYLRGPLYWSLVKSFRYFTESRKYPSTFSYNENYRNFLKSHLEFIISDRESPINHIYDVDSALRSLMNQPIITTEGPLHKFSNIIMHYLQYKKFTKQ